MTDRELLALMAAAMLRTEIVNPAAAVELAVRMLVVVDEHLAKRITSRPKP